MKRIAFGALWFFVFYLCGVIALAGVIAYNAEETTGDTPEQHFSQGYDSGYIAGKELGDRCRKFILLGAFVLSVTGTGLRWLPGTRKK